MAKLKNLTRVDKAHTHLKRAKRALGGFVDVIKILQKALEEQKEVVTACRVDLQVAKQLEKQKK